MRVMEQKKKKNPSTASKSFSRKRLTGWWSVHAEFATPDLASLTQMTLVRLAIVRHRIILRCLNLKTLPLLDPVHDPLRVRAIVKNGRARVIAHLAPLEVYPSIVPVLAVHSNCDGDFLASPTIGGTHVVLASKAAHDVGVVVFDAGVRIIDFVEGEVREVGFFEELDYFGVEAWVKGPGMWFVDGFFGGHGAGHGSIGRDGRVSVVREAKDNGYDNPLSLVVLYRSVFAPGTMSFNCLASGWASLIVWELNLLIRRID